jgi:hypothetical protein
MRTQRRSLVAILAILSTTGCGVWPFNQVFHGILEGGSTVTNTSLGITYTIPKGFYQDKYEATTIKLVILNQHENGAHQPGKRPWIYIQRVDEERENSTEQPLDDAKNLALSWVGYTENAASNIRQSSWEGPHLPGGEYAYDSVNADGKPESCAVAVVGYPGHRIQINSMGGNGRPVYLPEVHTVAVSVKLLHST